MKLVISPLAPSDEAALAVIDAELRFHYDTLEHLAVTRAVGAAHAARRAQIAQLLRQQIDWLEARRAEVIW